MLGARPTNFSTLYQASRGVHDGPADLLVHPDSNATAADFLRAKIRDVVEDPAVADLLSPDGIVGCKRLCVDTDYFATYNRDDVTLVDVSKQPIERLSAKGVVVGGREVELDAIVFATGFDAMTGALLRVDIRGAMGMLARDE